MNRENRRLLDEVITNRLALALEAGKDTDGDAFAEAMEAIDRQTELDKQKKEEIIKYVEIGAALVLAPIIETKCKEVFAKIVCDFEKDYTFTTTAGRALSSLFRFKK